MDSSPSSFLDRLTWNAPAVSIVSHPSNLSLCALSLPSLPSRCPIHPRGSRAASSRGAAEQHAPAPLVRILSPLFFLPCSALRRLALRPACIHSPHLPSAVFPFPVVPLPLSSPHTPIGGRGEQEERVDEGQAEAAAPVAREVRRAEVSSMMLAGAVRGGGGRGHGGDEMGGRAGQVDESQSGAVTTLSVDMHTCLAPPTPRALQPWMAGCELSALPYRSHHSGARPHSAQGTTCRDAC
ncbi:unnamed protein product [Closterium sp. Naga37s-1]|nr:unnamed protein product [Closterium sp. Naga37s-1]